MKTDKYILLIILTIIFQTIKSQDVSFKASAPSVVQTGTPFTIVYTCKAQSAGKNFKAPSLKDFNYLGQSTSQSSSYSTTIINGRIQSEQSIIVSWYLSVEATKEGSFTIPAATVEVDGKTYSSNSLTITVTKGLPPSQTNVQQTPTFNDDFDYIAENISSNLFLNLSSNKTSAYVGEPIYVYCKMFSAYNVNLKDFKPSTFENFWNKDLPMPQQIQAKNERINNKNFLTAVLDHRVVFPQKSGKLTLSPYQATFQLYDSWGFPAGSKKVVSNTKYIEVKPLPANKPSSFTGAVGNYKISLVSEDISKINIDQTYSITLKIVGKGNIGLFDVPKLNLPTTFELLTPETNQNINPTSTGIEGTITVKYTFIPRVVGKYNIEPIKFSYFDYEQEQYKTLSTDSINIEVIGQTSNQTTLPNIVNATTQLSQDIRFIKTKSKFLNIDNFYIATQTYWILILAIIAIFIILMLALNRYIQKQSDIAYVKLKNANKVSIQRLKKAQKMLKANNIDQFYAEVLQALWGYVSDKFNIPISELTRNNVAEKLTAQNVQSDKINNFIKTIDICETARYAPSLNNYTPGQIFEMAQNTIVDFEKKS